MGPPTLPTCGYGAAEPFRSQKNYTRSRGYRATLKLRQNGVGFVLSVYDTAFAYRCVIKNLFSLAITRTVWPFGRVLDDQTLNGAFFCWERVWRRGWPGSSHRAGSRRSFRLAQRLPHW